MEFWFLEYMFSLGLSGCSHFCENTLGSYSCFCPSGYHLEENQITCMGISIYMICLHVEKTSNKEYCSVLLLFYPDFNECKTDQHKCDGLCINTAGSYLCDCEQGFLLNTDGRSCDGERCISMYSV